MKKAALTTFLMVAFVLYGCSNNQLQEVSENPKPAKLINKQESQTQINNLSKLALRVRNTSCDGIATGTGFAISEYTLVTNRHVVDGALKVNLNTWDGESISARILKASTYDDIAVLRVNQRLPKVGKISNTTFTGERVKALGYPLGGKLALTSGAIQGSFYDQQSGSNRLLSSAQVLPGNSGGPLINSNNQVVGVVTERLLKNNYSVAIPSSVLLKASRTAEKNIVKPCIYKYR
jgi:S1-C subfamily serine protease